MFFQRSNWEILPLKSVIARHYNSHWVISPQMFFVLQKDFLSTMKKQKEAKIGRKSRSELSVLLNGHWLPLD